MELFQRHLTTAAFKICGGVDINASLTKPTKQHPIPQAFTSKVVRAFVDALFAFLDGLVLLASNESPVVTGRIPPRPVTKPMGPNPLDLVDLRDKVRIRLSDDHDQPTDRTLQDTRTLVVISNFNHLTKAFIPAMLAQLEAAFGLPIAEENQSLLKVATKLDQNLFDGYVKPKSKVAMDLLRSGILDSEMDWYETPQPTGLSCSFGSCIMTLTDNFTSQQRSDRTCTRP